MPNPHPIQIQQEEEIYHARDAIKSGVKGAIAGGSVGLFAAAVQNSLSKQNLGVWGVIRRHGGTAAALSA